MNTYEWLTAVSKHPDTLNNDLIVAAAIALGEANGADCVDGLDNHAVEDCIEELEALGFLTATLTADHPAGVEKLFELTVPA